MTIRTFCAEHCRVLRWKWEAPLLALVCVPAVALTPYRRLTYVVAVCALVLGADLSLPSRPRWSALRRWVRRWVATLAPLVTFAGFVFSPVPLSRPSFNIVIIGCGIASAAFAASVSVDRDPAPSET
ncbi:MAG: hypothetical protein ACYDCS_12675 [Candidatus Dormibacteria bacterium]